MHCAAVWLRPTHTQAKLAEEVLIPALAGL